MKNIVWLASYPKSGNTWFRVLLDNYYTSGLEPVNINQLKYSKSASSRELFDLYSAINSSDLTDDEIDHIRPYVFEKISSEQKELIFFKVHDAWSKNKSGKSIFPPNVTKAVIYIIRNPLEVAVSYAHHKCSSYEESVKEINNPNNSFAANPCKLSFQLKQSILNWSKHVISWIENSDLPLHVIRYEDLVVNPQKEFAGTLEFLGITPNLKLVKKAIKNSRLEILQEQENISGFQEKPLKAKKFFRTGQIETWRNELNPKLINEIIRANKKVMQLFGYY